MSITHLSRASALLVAAACIGSARADSATALFTDRVGTGDVPGAFATLSLNDDGSIFATVTSLTPLKVRGVGFDSDVRYASHDFSSPDVLDSGWGTSFGVFETGWVHLPGFAMQSLSWTIGAPGSFSSVFDLFKGHGSAFDAYVNAEASEHDFTEYAANFTASPVPEPATLPVLMAGLSLVGLAARSRRRRIQLRRPARVGPDPTNPAVRAGQTLPAPPPMLERFEACSTAGRRHEGRGQGRERASKRFVAVLALP